MKKIFRDTFRLLRPRQWIKNLAIFAAITFNGDLFEFGILIHVFYGFLVLCALASAIYIVNDLFDIDKDRQHPFKRFRPLANKDIPVPAAILMAIVLTAGALAFSFFISPSFLAIAIIYILMQFSYSILLKHIAIIDILIVAAGYILRVYAGETLATGSHISVWLLLTTISLSLFLAIGKRRSELTLLSTHRSEQIASTRLTLSHYSERLLEVYASIFATSTFISYALFTFVENGKGLTVTNELFLPEFLPQTLQRKWLMVTIIPVVYGLMRYLQDIYEKHEGESPEKVLLSDKPLLATVITWIVLVITIIYIIQQSN
jgi:decaprenyl-phosphate phosphoribosyltransferase